MTSGDNDPSTEQDFWAIRNSLLPASPDMEWAADLLAAAADMFLAGRDDEAIALIHQADIATLFDVREQVSRAPRSVPNVLRLREVENLTPKLPQERRAPVFVSQSPLGENVFQRDRWRCRYCGCRVIPAKVRKWINTRRPGAIRWDTSIRLGEHAGFWALWASVDHIIPRSRGGLNEAENLVTACMVCNFAKEDFTLEQLGLAHPRAWQPALDGWDGLTRLTETGDRANHPKPAISLLPLASVDHGPTDDGVRVRAQKRPRSTLSPLSSTEYYSRLETSAPNSAEPLRAFLASLVEVGVEAEFIKSVVLRFLVGNNERVSAGSILTDGRMFCADAFYYARKHGHPDIGERYLAATADFSGGHIRARIDVPEVFGRDGRQINVEALLENTDAWRRAIFNFVRDMHAAMPG